MPDETHDRFSRARSASPFGMVICAGPTGSGKTTTLYAALTEINKPRAQHHDDRGPGRVRLAVDQPDPDQRPGGHHLRRRPEGRSCARTPTSSSSARSATPRPRGSRSSRRSPATSCSRRCTRPTRPARSHRFLDMGIEPFLVASSVIGGRRPAARAADLPLLPASRTSRPPRSSTFYRRSGRSREARVLARRGLQLLPPHRLRGSDRRVRAADRHATRCVR